VCNVADIDKPHSSHGPERPAYLAVSLISLCGRLRVPHRTCDALIKAPRRSSSHLDRRLFLRLPRTPIASGRSVATALPEPGTFITRRLYSAPLIHVQSRCLRACNFTLISRTLEERERNRSACSP